MEPLRFQIKKGVLMCLSEEVMEKFSSFRQTDPHHTEAGGLLIGHRMLSGEHLLIDRLTVPGSFDERLRSYFYRSFWHNIRLRRLWRKSSRVRTFVGVWHTHPEPDPTPSGLDLQDWKTQLARSRFDGDYLVFVIVGTTQTNAWIGFRSGGIRKLKEIKLT